MTAFTGASNFLNVASGGNSGAPERISVTKNGRIAGVAASATIAGKYCDLFSYDGCPGPGAVPGSSWVNPTNATNGGIFQTDPGGGKQKWMTFAGGGSNVQGTLIVYDLLGHVSGLSGTTTTAQTIASGTITRNTGGVGNRLWVVINTIIGTTGTTATVKYTDDANNANQVSPTFPIGATGNREATRIIPVPLLAGDTGVRVAADLDLLASTTTAGDIGIRIVRPLLRIPFAQIGVGGEMSCLAKAVPPIEIDTDACICFAWMANGVTAPEISDLLLCFVDN